MPTRGRDKASHSPAPHAVEKHSNDSVATSVMNMDDGTSEHADVSASPLILWRWSDALKTEIASLLGDDPDDLQEVFDEIEGCISLYLFNRRATALLPTRSECRADLQELRKAISIITIRSSGVDQAFSGLAEYQALVDAASRLGLLVNEMLAEPMKKGRTTDDRSWLISRLAGIFEDFTYTKAAVSWSNELGQYVGQFFEFVWRLQIPGLTDDAIGKAIQKALSEQRRGKDE